MLYIDKDWAAMGCDHCSITPQDEGLGFKSSTGDGEQFEKWSKIKTYSSKNNKKNIDNNE